MHEEGKMDDCLDFSRSQEEESKTARVIRKCSSLFTQFIKYVDDNVELAKVDTTSKAKCYNSSGQKTDLGT